MTDSGWHLDKRVPIGIIIAILVQTVTITWYASQLANQVETNREEIARIRMQSQNTPERLARIEEKLNAIIARMDRRDNDLRYNGGGGR